MRENEFQGKLIRELKELFPGGIVLKNDAGYIQGIPDLIVLYHDKWAALECKKSKIVGDSSPAVFSHLRLSFIVGQNEKWVKNCAAGNKEKMIIFE